MRLEIAYITPRRQRLKSAPAQALVDEYLKRARRFAPVEALAYESEAGLLAALERTATRTAPVLILLDSRGDNLSSEQIASRLGSLQQNGTQHTLFAIGPADGWSPQMLQRNTLRLAFGAITLPHELALVLLAEQLYRALTILANHPYHSGHD